VLVGAETADLNTRVASMLTRRSGVVLMITSSLVFDTAGLFTKGVATDA